MSAHVPLTPRRGHTLVELAVALAAGGLLLGGVAVILDSQSRLATDVRRAAGEADLVRTAGAVIGAELRYLLPDDRRAVAVDSLAVRVLRGVAYPCARDSLFAYDGLRRPAPAKDSVAATVTGRTARVTGWVDVAPDHAVDDPCRAWALPVMRLALEPSFHPDEPLVVFESGAYHIAAGALRYRLGGEGRQPLTEELLDAGVSRFEATGPASAMLHLAWRDFGGSRNVRRAEFRFTSLNRTPDHAQP
jgi:hypothetical protein